MRAAGQLQFKCCLAECEWWCRRLGSTSGLVENAIVSKAKLGASRSVINCPLLPLPGLNAITPAELLLNLHPVSHVLQLCGPTMRHWCSATFAPFNIWLLVKRPIAMALELSELMLVFAGHMGPSARGQEGTCVLCNCYL